MDRRHRALLSLAVGALVVGEIGSARAQSPGPAIPVVASVTPVPSVAPTPNEANRKRIAERMAERRAREFAPGPDVQRRIEQLPPEDQAAFKRNLGTWKQMGPDERQVLRMQADERMRAETEKAFTESGLRLNNDQHEVFALRYRQERRALERNLQSKLDAERQRDLPAIVDRLKREFNNPAGSPPRKEHKEKPMPPGSSPPVAAETEGGKPTPSVSVPVPGPSVH